MKKVPLLWIGILGCSILAFMFIFGPYLPKVDPNVSEHSYIIGPGGHLDFILPPYPPQERFPFGGDKDGRDLFSAMIVGTRSTLTTVSIISLVTFILALPFGIGAAHLRFLKKILEGWNYLFSRIPLFFFIILLTTIPFFFFSPHRPVWMYTFIIVLELGKVAEFVNKSVIEIQQTTYYDAAIISGTKIYGLWKNYYLPSCFSQWLSYFIQHMGTILFLLGQLGFFNIFVSQKLEQIPGPPFGPTPYEIVNTSIAWPFFLSDAANDIGYCPWVPISACVFITFAIFSFIALGKGIMQYSLLKQRGLVYRKERSFFRKRLSFMVAFKGENEISK